MRNLEDIEKCCKVNICNSVLAKVGSDTNEDEPSNVFYEGQKCARKTIYVYIFFEAQKYAFDLRKLALYLLQPSPTRSINSKSSSWRDLICKIIGTLETE